MKVYTGIGSRETPRHITDTMMAVADRLAADGWTLRSGNAKGADQAFERGHLVALSGSPIEVYLPWPSFEADWLKGWTIEPMGEPTTAAEVEARRFHPAWSKLSDGAKKLHARNVHQILGPDVSSPILSKFVICWTKGGKGEGGTGQALRIARHYNVPIFDLAIEEDYHRVTGLFA